MVTTVTDNSPQAINTSLFSLEKDTDGKVLLLNNKIKEANDAIAAINKILDGINKDAGVVSVNGKQGIVTLDASDIGGLATVATSGSYNDLSNKPNLATVATSGSYNDLSNKPTIPSKTSQLTNDSGFVSPQNVLFNDADVPEGSGNLNTTATAHKITTYRNGLTIPYQMDDNTNDGGLLRVRGTSEDNCILELGTWDDSGSGETIQFNYYPTTSQVTPTHSVSVPKKSGTIALTSDVPTKTSQLTNDSDFATNSALNSVTAVGLKETYHFTRTNIAPQTWTDIIKPSDIPQSGIYVFNLSFYDNTFWWSENATFLTYFFATETNSTNSTPIHFNQEGHAPNGQTIQLRFQRVYGNTLQQSIQIYFSDCNQSTINLEVFAYRVA